MSGGLRDRLEPSERSILSTNAKNTMKSKFTKLASAIALLTLSASALAGGACCIAEVCCGMPCCL
jgi:hypothetical protein